MTRRRARRFGSLLAAALFFSPAALAHYDGTPEESNPPRHYYYWATQTGQASHDPQISCEQYCTVTQSRAFYNVFYDPSDSNGKWKCQCEAASPPGAPGTIHTATNGNERHCNLGEAFTSGTGGACSSGGPGNCMARKGEYVSWSWSQNPHGFNLPDDEEDIPAGTWKGLSKCSVKRISATDTGFCYSVTYSITGSGKLDEDGLPLVLDDGNNWPTGVPGTCNEADDTEDDWPDNDGGGSGGGGVFPTEEEPDLEDPTEAPTGQMEEDTDSWLDSLLEPSEWDDGVLASFMPDFELWNVVPDECGGSSLNFSFSGGLAPGGFTITCEKAAAIRHWLGVAVVVMFGWWLIQTALTLPRT